MGLEIKETQQIVDGKQRAALEQLIHCHGRLAFRHEDDRWNAYYCRPDTMEGAIFVGAIAYSVVDGNERIKSIFMTMMQGAVCTMFENVGMKPPVWGGSRRAPEHERKP